MQIFILRHGHAEPAGPGVKDADRRLDTEGKKQAKRVGRWLADHKVAFDAIVSSPYPRAREMAQPIAAALGSVEVTLDQRLASGAFDAVALAEVLAELGDPARVLLIGHEPDLSLTINTLIGGGEVELKTGTLAMVECMSSRLNGGKLRWLVPQAIM